MVMTVYVVPYGSHLYMCLEFTGYMEERTSCFVLLRMLQLLPILPHLVQA